MEVFITGTPEINNDEIGRVVDFLNCQKGPINFIDLKMICTLVNTLLFSPVISWILNTTTLKKSGLVILETRIFS